MNMPQPVSPARAAALMAEGATLVDIRSPGEFARRRIPGSVNRPLGSSAALPDGPVIFGCLSGMRTAQNAAALGAAASGPSFLLDGGLNAWARAGLPTDPAAGRGLDIMRQVQIIAGSLALLGVLLGSTVHPYFYAIPGFVGAGLLTAGVTGYCALAHFLLWLNPPAKVSSP